MTVHGATDPAKELGPRLRELRHRAGITQEELAHLAGMDTKSYGQLERGIGNPQLVTLIRIAFVLETSVSDLTRDVTTTSIPPSMRKLTVRDLLKAQEVHAQSLRERRRAR